SADETDVHRAAAGGQLAVGVQVGHLDGGAGLGPVGVPAAVHLLPAGRPGVGERPAVDRGGAGVGDVDAGHVAVAPVVDVGEAHRAGAGRRAAGGDGQRRRRPGDLAGGVAGQDVDRVP